MLLGHICSQYTESKDGNKTCIDFDISIERKSRVGDETKTYVNTVNVLAYNKLAELITKYKSEGDQIYLEGYLIEGHKIIITEVNFI